MFGITNIRCILCPTIIQQTLLTPYTMATLDLAQLQTIIDNATKSEAKTKELRRVINRATAALENLAIIFGDINTVLGDDYEPSATTRSPRAKREAGPVDAEAPYGRKKDGTPKGKPGRGGAAAGEGTGELDLASGGNVVTGRTADEAPAAAKKEKVK
jgi:hypothetical protein